MAFRKSPSSLPGWSNARNGGYRASVVALLLVSVVAPLFILATRTTTFLFPGLSSDDSSVSTGLDDGRRRSALEGLEALFPREVLDIVNSNSEGSGALNLNIVGHKETWSSWVQEESLGLVAHHAVPVVFCSGFSAVTRKSWVILNFSEGEPELAIEETSLLPTVHRI